MCRRESKWGRRRDSNPFKGNVGVARRMKGLGIDPDDPAVDAMSSNLDPGLDAAAQVVKLCMYFLPYFPQCYFQNFGTFYNYFFWKTQLIVPLPVCII